MALLAGLRHVGLYVVRLRSALEVPEVAIYADRVGAGQVVVVIDMAVRAWRRHVSARQRETGCRVIEIRSCPVRGGMALLTGLRDAGLGVVRVIGFVEVRKVATDAGSVGDGVVVVDVAGFAADGSVGTGQRPTLRRVAKVDVGPLSGVMAHRAGRRLT